MPRPPLVGLSTYRQHASWGAWRSDAALVPTGYVDCVAGAGGRPILVPPVHVVPTTGPVDAAAAAARDAVRRVVEALDALVLIGGADVDPVRYGAEADPATGEPQPWRDDNELELLDAALEGGKPVLAVCRGMQVLNTALGGSLHQHVPDLVGHTTHQPAVGQFGGVEVHSAPGSKVAGFMGERFVTTCSHHQSLDALGKGLRATAHATDGVIEAVELDEVPFVVGVQWHPEQAGDLRPFAALVAACGGAAPVMTR